MPTLTVKKNNLNTATITVDENMTVMKALRLAGTGFSFPCGGRHTCGKCLVKITGDVSPATQGELALLGSGADRYRLACFTKIKGDVTVEPADRETGDRIALSYETGELSVEPVYSGAYGAAVDIGTTTVVAYLFSRQSGEPIATEGAMNDQRAYGADVLSRIDYCNFHGVASLSSVIREQINSMLLTLCRDGGIRADALSGVVITGNTAMLHIAACLEPRELAAAPFTPTSLFGSWADFKFKDFSAANVYFAPCISAYVGADISCGILSSGIIKQKETVLLVDIGTNGEMALRIGDELICCSTAAGPAFEGAGISAGMSAKGGAINKAWICEGQICFSTIDGLPPKGICGSGLIDAVCVMLQLGLIESSGRIPGEYGGKLAIGDSGINITQSDVRQLQLAKGAIRAGMDTLLHECKVSYDEISEIILCGGFGSFLDPRSAEGIGLIPKGMSSRTRAVGNAAGAGAGRMLQCRMEFDEATAIADLARTVELSYSEFFRKRFITAMTF